MDPLTRAAQAFVRDLAEAWRRTGPVRLIAPTRHRTYLLRSLRLFEWAPENRWPLCVVELAGGDVDALADTVAGRVLADLAELRRGLAEDGVALAETEAPEGGDPWLRLQRLVALAGEALVGTGAVAGLAVAIVPAAQVDRRTARRLAEELRAWPHASHVRVGLWGGDEDVLDEAIPDGVRFELDDEAVHQFCREQSERLAASAPPAEAAIHRHLLVASEAARRGDMAAAKQAYAAAGAALEQMGRRAEAGVVQVALGGLSLGLGDRGGALGHFDRAVEHAEAVKQPTLAAQAHLGAAGALFSGRAYVEAATRYRAAACSGPDPLRIEALRMAGVSHAQIGERDAASAAWQEAIDCAKGLPAVARAQTSWKQAGAALVELLQRRGSTEQAEHLRAVLDGDAEGRDAQGG